MIELPKVKVICSLPPGEPVEGETLRADGWVYRDLPARLSFEMWDLLLEIMGEGNYRILAMTIGPDFKRGQFMISPDGIANMVAYRAAASTNPAVVSALPSITT